MHAYNHSAGTRPPSLVDRVDVSNSHASSEYGNPVFVTQPGTSKGTGAAPVCTPVFHGHAPAAGHATSTYGVTVNPAMVTPPGTGVAPAAPLAVPMPVPAQLPPHVPTAHHTPTPPRLTLAPAHVPPGAYPIELVQFWRGESSGSGRRPNPLHWALFVRTANSSAGSGRAQAAQGSFYEVVGTSETYTAQFLPVTFSPESLPDWRGTHVIGWVYPAHMGTFERAARQVPVWRGRADWRCQQWAHEVVCALSGSDGIGVQWVAFGVVQRQMGWLLEAWENGDI